MNMPVAAPTPVTEVDLFSALRDDIVNQKIAPGSRLRELQLVETYQAPRAKVRDALVALEQRGLVERIPNRGAVVIKLDPAQVSNIYQVREVLEGLVARLACENTAPSDWQDLLAEFEGPMRQHVAAHHFQAFIAGYERFRLRMLVAADNPTLHAMIDSIYEKTQVIIRRVIVLPGRGEQGLAEHIAVLRALCAGNAQDAEQLRRASLRSAREAFRAYESIIL